MSERTEVRGPGPCQVCTIEIDGGGDAVHESDCTLADLERQLAEAVDSYEAMRHSWSEEHDVVLAVREWRELHGHECNGRSEMSALDAILGEKGA